VTVYPVVSGNVVSMKTWGSAAPGGETGGVTILMVSEAVVLCEAVSLTWTVKVLLAPVVGVPEISPVAGLSVNPAGNWPEVMLQVRAPVPPAASSVA
jgi:hypothetical protein